MGRLTVNKSHYAMAHKHKKNNNLNRILFTRGKWSLKKHFGICSISFVIESVCLKLTVLPETYQTLHRKPSLFGVLCFLSFIFIIQLLFDWESTKQKSAPVYWVHSNHHRHLVHILLEFKPKRSQTLSIWMHSFFLI